MCPENIFSDLKNLAILESMKRKTRPSSRGSVFIETGIALAFMLMMIGGIILIATQLNRYSKVTESLSQAARLGSTVSGLAEGGEEVSCSSSGISSAVESICTRAQRLLTENGVFPATAEGATQALAALSVSHTPLMSEDGKAITNRSVVSVRAEVPLFPIGSVSIGQINVRGASPYLVNESNLEGGGGTGSSGSAGSTGGIGGSSGSGSGSSGSSSGLSGATGVSSKGVGSKGISLSGNPVDDSDSTSGTGIKPIPISGEPPSDSDDAVDGDDSGGLPVDAVPATVIPVSEDDGSGDDESVPASPVPSTPIVLATAIPTAAPSTATAIPATVVPATEVPADVDDDVKVLPPPPTVNPFSTPIVAATLTPLSAAVD